MGNSLVPQLKLGNSDLETPASCFPKLELRFAVPNLEIGNQQNQTIRLCAEIIYGFPFIALPIKQYYYLSITHKQVITMRVTSKGQVTITQNVREDMGILPAETEIEFQQDENGRWYINKTPSSKKKTSRFRTAHKAGNLTMSTDDIMALTRG